MFLDDRQLESGSLRARLESSGSGGMMYWDESVGRRLFVWDTINLRWQMTYGDTGWRQITTLLNGFTGDISVRRTGYTVECRIQVTAPGSQTTIWTPPTGFNPASPRQVVFSTRNTSSGAISAGMAAADISLYSTPTVSQGIIAGFTYMTYQAWPTVLPGVAWAGAEGVIPNL